MTRAVLFMLLLLAFSCSPMRRMRKEARQAAEAEAVLLFRADSAAASATERQSRKMSGQLRAASSIQPVTKFVPIVANRIMGIVSASTVFLVKIFLFPEKVNLTKAWSGCILSTAPTRIHGNAGQKSAGRLKETGFASCRRFSCGTAASILHSSR